ncbi:MAG TPA: hypothetical protein VJV97_07305, partial [Gemmatimonadaceae bacterium]|nr:hypothetical protein [Gemmatimonadaceae bacterium]
RPSGEYDPYFDQYFDYWATKTFSYDRQTATSRKFSKIAGDRGAATIFFGHSDLVADLKFNDSWKELSSFTIRNELAIIAACNSSAFLGDLKLGPGASAIGFSSNRKDANGTSGYIESGHLGILAARGLDLLQKGFMPKAVAANLPDFAKANAKTWGYRVSVDFVEYVPKK